LYQRFHYCTNTFYSDAPTRVSQLNDVITFGHMKKLLLVLGAASLVACMHERNDNGTTMNEPAGAANTNSMQMQSEPRDINQQPYPGQSDLNQQRGSGSSSSSSLQVSSDSSSSNPSGTSSSSSQNP